MSEKNVGGISRRSSSLKERLFVNRERKKSHSVRARMQSSGALKAGSENDLTNAPPSTKYNLVKEASVRVYKLEPIESRNPWERLRNNSRFPWSWDTQILVLGEKEIYSTMPTGVLVDPIPYANIQTWMVVTIPQLPLSYIKASTKNCSFLIQTPDTYQRDRLLHSVQWKRNVCKYNKVLQFANHPDAVLHELQSLVKNAIDGPLCIDDTNNTLLDIVSNVLVLNSDTVNSVPNESLIVTLAPLFEQNQPSIEICRFFTKHCRNCPRSRVVIEMFNPVVQRILKYNTNFGKTMWLRTFVKEYIQALNAQNDGEAAVRAFVRKVHGPLTICPHKRILNNLVSVCLSAIYDSFTPHLSSGQCDDGKKEGSFDPEGSSAKKLPKHQRTCENEKDAKFKITGNELWTSPSKFEKNAAVNHKNNFADVGTKDINLNEYHDTEKDADPSQEQMNHAQDDVKMVLFAQVLDEISSINDWLQGLAVLLQPIPIHEEALRNEEFVRYIAQIIKRMIEDGHEQVIWCLVSLREQKDGWLQVFSLHSNILQDDGNLFIKMTSVLLESAKRSSKTKKLVTGLLNTCLDDVLLLALRESEVMIEVLCFIIEYRLVTGRKEMQIVSTLRSTTLGKSRYERLCEQEAIMLQKGGPDEYTLPARSTDQDLQKFLCSGSNGNLKNLNLSFTYVSCKSADIISKLPALQHLNLWSSNIQDVGLRRLCESLNLESLNLCETRVTDESIMCLKDMTNLTDLNLNSTPVTDSIYQELRNNLPNLVRCDIRYTEAWPDDAKLYGETNNARGGVKEVDRLSKLAYKQNI